MSASGYGIFISYRRDDSAYPAGWLFDLLAGRFGRDRVFKDVDSLQPGDDFAGEITAAVGACAVLLAVIGKSWLTRAREDGRRRLDEPGDLVRLEIEAALACGIRVIPVLVDGALMPGPGQLPASLAKLAGRQAVELSPAHFSSDARRLLMTLEKTLTQVPGSPPRPLLPPLPHPAAWTAPADAEHFCAYCGFPFRPSQQNQEYCNQYPLPAHGRCGRRHQDAQSDEGLRKRLDVTQRVRPDSRRTPEDAIAHEWVRRNRPGFDLSPWQATAAQPRMMR